MSVLKKVKFTRCLGQTHRKILHAENHFGELPHEGMITYQGKQLERTKLADWRKPIGYMPQDSRVDASLTALEVVLLGRMDSLTMRVAMSFSLKQQVLWHN